MVYFSVAMAVYFWMVIYTYKNLPTNPKKYTLSRFCPDFNAKISNLLA